MSPAIAILGFALLMLIGGSIATFAENKASKVKELEQELKIAKDDYEWSKIYYSLSLEKRISDLELQTGLARKL